MPLRYNFLNGSAGRATVLARLMVVPADEVPEGAGARVRRLMPSPRLPHLDPFVLFDHATVAPPAGFPAHPHRGFEIVTYMLEGAFTHWDSAGHEEVVAAGGSQRITAGRGIVHSEMPAGHGPACGLQLWINLPRRLKDLPPDYQTVPAAGLPEEERAEARVRHVVGGGSPISLHTDVIYQDVLLRGPLAWRVPAGFSGFAYVIGGAVRVRAGGSPLAGGLADDEGLLLVPAGQALVVEDAPPASPESGGLVFVLSPDGAGEAPHAREAARAREARLALVCGRPHGEPIRLWGPYVL